MAAAKDINSVHLIGRLTRDCELRYTSAGYPIGKLSLAVNRLKKTGERWESEGNFFDLVFFGKRAESLAAYLTKGTRVAVLGELKQERWENNGKTHSRVVVQVQDIQLLGSARTTNIRHSSEQQQSERTDAPNRPRSWHEFTGVPKEQEDPSLFQGPEDFEDDIPF